MEFSINRFRQWEEDGDTFIECYVNDAYTKARCVGNKKEDVEHLLGMVHRSCKLAKYTGFRKKVDLNSAIFSRSIDHDAVEKTELPEWDEAIELFKKWRGTPVV